MFDMALVDNLADFHRVEVEYLLFDNSSFQLISYKNQSHLCFKNQQGPSSTQI